ncbi:MAG: HNH endonuclease [Fibrobacteres bacterium]|nr:HNH endonuclease [Fibrobacterota bacterium]
MAASKFASLWAGDAASVGYKSWNAFQSGTKGQFASRAEAGMAWGAYKEANNISFGVARSAGVRAQFLRSLAADTRTPSWQIQWLKAGRLPPGYEVHHIVPLSVGGADATSNMQLQAIDLHVLHHQIHHPWR